MMYNNTLSYMNTTSCNGTSSMNDELFYCRPIQRLSFLGAACVPMVDMIINMIVLVIILKKRKKLMRTNYVYYCVASSLLANFFVGFFMEYTLLEQYFFIEGRSVVNLPSGGEEPDFNQKTLNSTSPYYFYDHHKNPLSLFLGMWWAFRKSLMVSLFTIQCANIGALIYLLRDSVEITSRARKNRKNDRDKDIVSAKQKKKRVLYFLVCSWVLPLTFGCLPVTFAGWNCVYECRCPPGDYGKTFCPREKGCHRIWDPMTASFILLAASLWFVEVVSLVILLFLSIRRERQAFVLVLKPTRRSTRHTTYLPNISDAARKDKDAQNCHIPHDLNPTELIFSPVTQNDLIRNMMPKSVQNDDQGKRKKYFFKFRNNSVASHVNANKEKHDLDSRRFVPPLSASLKFLIYLTSLFIVSTSPIMIVAMVDALSKEYLLFGSINLFVGAMNFLYCSVSPFMLVYYMPDLKLIVASMLAR